MISLLITQRLFLKKICTHSTLMLISKFRRVENVEILEWLEKVLLQKHLRKRKLKKRKKRQSRKLTQNPLKQANPQKEKRLL